jgi:hypothetical protein
MRTGRPKQPLILTEEERDRIESLVHRGAYTASSGATGPDRAGLCRGNGQ